MRSSLAPPFKSILNFFTLTENESLYRKSFYPHSLKQKLHVGNFLIPWLKADMISVLLWICKGQSQQDIEINRMKKNCWLVVLSYLYFFKQTFYPWLSRFDSVPPVQLSCVVVQIYEYGLKRYSMIPYVLIPPDIMTKDAGAFWLLALPLEFPTKLDKLDKVL